VALGSRAVEVSVEAGGQALVLGREREDARQLSGESALLEATETPETGEESEDFSDGWAGDRLGRDPALRSAARPLAAAQISASGAGFWRPAF